MFLWYFGVFLLSFFTLLIWDYWSKKERNRVLRYMPGPKALPIFGNIFLYRGLDAEGIIKDLQKHLVTEKTSQSLCFPFL